MKRLGPFPERQETFCHCSLFIIVINATADINVYSEKSSFEPLPIAFNIIESYYGSDLVEAANGDMNT